MPLAVTTAPAPCSRSESASAEQVARRVARARVVVGALLAEGAKRERGSQVQRGHDAAGRVVAFDSRAHRPRDRIGGAVAAVSHDAGRCLSDWLTGMLRLAVGPVSPVSRGACLRCRLVASIPPGTSRARRATLTAHLSTPVCSDVAGVGTFPGWLSLAVAPASKGLIPQPVSMSDSKSRGLGGRTQAPPRAARAPFAVMRISDAHRRD